MSNRSSGTSTVSSNINVWVLVAVPSESTVFSNRLCVTVVWSLTSIHQLVT